MRVAGAGALAAGALVTHIVLEPLMDNVAASMPQATATAPKPL